MKKHLKGMKKKNKRKEKRCPASTVGAALFAKFA